MNASNTPIFYIFLRYLVKSFFLYQIIIASKNIYIVTSLSLYLCAFKGSHHDGNRLENISLIKHIPVEVINL